MLADFQDKLNKLTGAKPSQEPTASQVVTPNTGNGLAVATDWAGGIVVTRAKPGGAVPDGALPGGAKPVDDQLTCPYAKAAVASLQSRML